MRAYRRKPQLTPITRTIEKTTYIDQHPEAVWAVLADFGGVANWAPRMKHSRVTNGQNGGVGTRRVMRHVWGFRIEETVTDWEEGSGFTFRLDRAPPPLREVVETWRIESAAGGTRVCTRVTYRAGWAAIGRIADACFIRFLVAREMTTSLRSLRHFADYRLRTASRRAGE